MQKERAAGLFLVWTKNCGSGFLTKSCRSMGGGKSKKEFRIGAISKFPLRPKLQVSRTISSSLTKHRIFQQTKSERCSITPRVKAPSHLYWIRLNEFMREDFRGMTSALN